MNPILILTLALAPGQPQFFPDPPPATAPAPDPPVYSGAANNAVARKEARDQVLRSVGPEALAFTKHFGDLGIYSLQKCGAESGKRLVALFAKGGLAKLKDARSALEPVRNHGDPAADWLCANAEKLQDAEAAEAWAKSPLEFVYDLRSIEQAAEEMRSSRKYVPRSLTGVAAEWNSPYVVFGGLLALMLAAAYLKHGRKAA